MKLVSINELSLLTGCTRETVTRKVAGIEPKPGEKRAKLYPSDAALRKILGTETIDGEEVTAAEAQRQLTIARKQEIDLNMEVTSRKRIPLEIVNEVNDQVFQGINGILKSNAGKALTDEILKDIQGLLRDAPSRYKW